MKWKVEPHRLPFPVLLFVVSSPSLPPPLLQQLLNYFINFNLIQLIRSPLSLRLKFPLSLTDTLPVLWCVEERNQESFLRLLLCLINDVPPHAKQRPPSLLFCDYSARCSGRCCALAALKYLVSLTPLTPPTLN